MPAEGNREHMRFKGIAALITRYVVLLVCLGGTLVYSQVPVITFVSPNSGPVGSTITLTGTNFSPTASNNIVYFGAVRATNVIAASATNLTVIVPAGATYAPVTVAVNGLAASAAAPFDVTFPTDRVFLSSTFSSASFSPGSQPTHIAIGDLDGDGKPDLATAHSTANTLSLYRNLSTNGTLVSASFASPVTLGAGGSSYAFAISDVDADGRLDLVTLDATANMCRVFRNTNGVGSMTFTQAVSFATGAGPRAAAVADFDGDGRPDIVTVDGSAGGVSFHRNTNSSGGLAFDGPVSLATGASPVQLAIGDLNGDGKPDIVVSSYLIQRVTVLTNGSSPGNFLFGPKLDLTNSPGPFGVAIGDIDGDSKPDVITADFPSGDTFSAYHNESSSGSLAFGPQIKFLTGSQPVLVNLADLDGNGKVDVVVGTSSGDWLYRNVSQPGSITTNSFEPGVVLAANGEYVATGDMDGDGRVEVVSCGYGGGGTLFRNGTWPFEVPAITSLSTNSGTIGSTLDISGSGFSTNATNNFVYLGAVRATVVSATSSNLSVIVPAGASYAPISVTVNGRTSVASVPFNATFPSSHFFDSASFMVNADVPTSGPFAAAPGDFDGDGKVDLAVANFLSASVSIFRNSTTETNLAFTSATNLVAGSNPYSVVVGDLDGDGRLDAVAANYGSNTVSVFRNTSTNSSIRFAPALILPVNIGPVGCALVDLDGDGSLDLAAANSGNTSGNTLSVFRNVSTNGNLTFEAKQDLITGTAPHWIADGDLDGDGKPDLAVGNRFGSSISVLRNMSSPGVISFANTTNYATSAGPNEIVMADMDGDGKLDLAASCYDPWDVYNTNGYKVSVLRNTSSPGVPSFAVGTNFLGGGVPKGLAAGDLDGDGRPDLVVGNADLASRSVTVLRNNGTPGLPAFFAPVDYKASGGESPTLADVDGDGRLDILVTDYYGAGGRVAVFRNTIGSPLPITISNQTNGSVSASPSLSGYYVGQPVTLTATPYRYYAFHHWSDGDTNNPRAITIAPSNNTYAAIFTNTEPLEQLTFGPVTWVAPVGTPVILLNGQFYSNNVVVATNGTQFTVTMQTSFANGEIDFTTDGSDPNAGAIYTGPFLVSAPFSIRTVAFNENYTTSHEADAVNSLSATTPGGGSVMITSAADLFTGAVSAGATAITNAGWNLLGWSGDTSGTNASVSIPIDGAKAVQATFGTSLSTAATGGGAGSVQKDPNQFLYAYGTSVRLSAIPANGSYFRFWNFAGTGLSNSPINFVVTIPNTNVNAVFALLPNTNTFALTTLINGQGSVSKTPQSQNYTNGQSVTLTATPEVGFAFTDWSGDATGTVNPLSVTMNTNKVITANFAPSTPGTNNPPTIAVTNPVAGATFTAPVNVTINGTASDSDGTVTQVSLFAGTNLLATLTNATFHFVWTNATVGTNIPVVAVATDNTGNCTTSSPVLITVSLPPAGPPVFSLSTNAWAILENGGSVTVTVQKSLNSFAGAVNYSTANGSAIAFAGGVGDYQPASGSLAFTNGETSKTVTISIVDDFSYEGNQQFSFGLSLAGDGSLGSPSTATITIVEDDPVSSTNSFLSRLNPGAVPLHNGQLRQIIAPTIAGGQWRLVWETAWRNSGDTISGLPAGNYEVEFKPVTGYLAPANATNPVVVGQLNSYTNSYPLNGSPQFGSLAVTLTPASLGSAAQWRLQGETNWHDSGFQYLNLPVGNQIVEFKSVAGWVAPAPRTVLVSANQFNSIAAAYLIADSTGATPPSVLQFNIATTVVGDEPPYPWVGQLLTQSGYGSGTVVRRRVVLTAAHVVFNDAMLAFVPEARWFFQRYSGEFEPPAQLARGWYAFSGYAAARSNDNSPGISSPTSQNLDVAALYFLEDAGRGGQSGYLVSDPGGTEWLTTGQSKVLIGYPVEEVGEINRGRLHATVPGNIGFDPVTNRVFSTTAIRGHPGMSGGPLCVKFTNQVYYPAAVYLGGSAQTIVRAIDGAVADLINRADVSANTGDNNTGGGVVLWSNSATGQFNPGLFRVSFYPGNIIELGAGWRVQGSTNLDWISDANLYYPLTPGAFNIEFRPVANYSAPPPRPVNVAANQTTVIDAFYSLISLTQPQLLANGDLQMTLGGATGRVYWLQASTNLVDWTNVRQLTNATGVLVFTNAPVTGSPVGFFRIKE